MKSLIIGLGEIGTAVKQVIEAIDDVYTYDTDPEKVTRLVFKKIDILHVCFPPGENFIKDVYKYIEEWEPDHVIVWSSTPIGTCAAISSSTVHSPVEGVHPNLAAGIRAMVRFLGCEEQSELDFFEEYFDSLNLASQTFKDSRFTEFLKLRSTSKYGINLAWTDYEKSVTDDLGMDFQAVIDYDEAYNSLYQSIGMQQYQRYLLTPPEGKIGGHCIIQNAEILDEQYPNEMLKLIKGFK